MEVDNAWRLPEGGLPGIVNQDKGYTFYKERAVSLKPSKNDLMESVLAVGLGVLALFATKTFDSVPLWGVLTIGAVSALLPRIARVTHFKFFIERSANQSITAADAVLDAHKDNTFSDLVDGLSGLAGMNQRAVLKQLGSENKTRILDEFVADPETVSREKLRLAGITAWDQIEAALERPADERVKCAIGPLQDGVTVEAVRVEDGVLVLRRCAGAQGRWGHWLFHPESKRALYQSNAPARDQARDTLDQAQALLKGRAVEQKLHELFYKAAEED